MSTLKSSNDHLTLNADGTSKDIKFQADGVEKASISSAGAFTSTTIDATKLTGNLPAISGASLTGVGVDGISSASTSGTAINIDSANNVGIQSTPESHHSTWTSLQFGGTGNITGQTAQSANKQVVIANNAYVDSTETWSHIVTDEASMYRQMGGKHTFLVAPSGTADANLAISTALEIKNDGSVTMPSQPAFNVHVGSALGITANTWHQFVFSAERFDIGSNFSGNVFTAPITGKYQLSFHTRINNLRESAGYYQVRIASSNKSYVVTVDPGAFDSDSNYWSFSLSALADMDSNDTAYCSVYQNGGASSAIEAHETVFSGFLVA